MAGSLPPHIPLSVALLSKSGPGDIGSEAILWSHLTVTTAPLLPTPYRLPCCEVVGSFCDSLPCYFLFSKHCWSLPRLMLRVRISACHGYKNATARPGLVLLQSTPIAFYVPLMYRSQRHNDRPEALKQMNGFLLRGWLLGMAGDTMEGSL